MMDKELAQSLRDAFRKTRNQIENSGHKGWYTEEDLKPAKQNKRNAYTRFLEKYENLTEEVENFNALDLMYFFQTKARESGINYVIANRMRDAGVFKNLLDKYKASELCLMIEFLFESEQNYLDKHIVQPTVLASTYCNKIYRDSCLWANDEYVPSAKKLTKKPVEREWNREVKKKDSAKIGEWD